MVREGGQPTKMNTEVNSYNNIKSKWDSCKTKVILLSEIGIYIRCCEIEPNTHESYCD